MLSRITIANLATISNLTLEFDEGFAVFTGETGAGKSILIDALRLVLGARGAVHLMRGGASQAMVEAEFRLEALPEVRERLEALGVPDEDNLVVRRVLLANGRSRVMVNDCAISLPNLEGLAVHLVNIHGQHDNQMLLQPANHIHFLDRYGGLLPLRGKIEALHARHTALVRKLREAAEQAQVREQHRAALAATIADIRQAALQPGEMVALEQEHSRLTHAEKLIELTRMAEDTLYEGQNAVYPALGNAVQALQDGATLDAQLGDWAEALTPLRIQIEEVARALVSYRARLEPDPHRLEWVNERLATIEKLARRFGGTEQTVLKTLAESEQELETLEAAASSKDEIETERKEVAKYLHSSAKEISAARSRVAAALDREVLLQLGELGMEKAHFETRISPRLANDRKTPAHGPLGADDVEFLLGANPGLAAHSLSRIASGGELSRIMLALKSVLAQADPTNTLVFDEVDAGVSGATAEMVGLKLRALGNSHQVLCVTHLPQIAALGAHHVRISKTVADDQTYTVAETLDEQGKVKEVARLLSGIDPSAQSLRSAREMLQRGQRTAP